MASEKQVVQKQKRNVSNQMPEQNGVRMPRPGTQSAKIWKLADQLTAKLRKKDPSAVTPIAPILDKMREVGVSDLNTRNQYSRWRKFNGITGRYVTAKK